MNPIGSVMTGLTASHLSPTVLFKPSAAAASSTNNLSEFQQLLTAAANQLGGPVQQQSPAALLTSVLGSVPVLSGAKSIAGALSGLAGLII